MSVLAASVSSRYGTTRRGSYDHACHVEKPLYSSPIDVPTTYPNATPVITSATPRQPCGQPLRASRRNAKRPKSMNAQIDNPMACEYTIWWVSDFVPR